MASSESETREMQSMLERLITSRNRDLSLFLPFLLGFDPDPTRPDPAQTESNPGRDSGNDPTPDDERDRIVLINPVTQGMVVIEGRGFDSLFRGAQSDKGGHPPAAKSAIEALPSVGITEEDQVKECVICLEECGVGEMVKEMPCQHRFHGGCIEKWLNLHGSCPVCRFSMPCDETVGKKIDTNDGDDNGEGDGGERRGRREVWVSFTIGRRRNNDNDNDNDNDNVNSTEEVEGSGRELDSGEEGNRSEE